MSLEDRIEVLERRLAVLETLVRQLAAAEGHPGRIGRRSSMRPNQHPHRVPHRLPHRLPNAPQPCLALPPLLPPSPTIQGRSPLTSEQWIGQRVFLGIGVAALLGAAGYLLKLSFDRNWITPVMRCLGGVGAGVVVGAIGWRLHGRYRTYGAALIGAGAGIIYLSVWAAARLYGVLPSATGIVGLALVSVALAMIAYGINVEALGTTAALGAFFAPVLLGESHTRANLLLLYLASMAAGLGLVAARRRWRLTMFVVAASYFGVGIAGAAERAVPWAVLLYGVVGGTAGLYLGLRERWWETRLLTFSGGWWLLAAANDRIQAHWVTLAAGIALAAPVWWHGIRSPRVFPIRWNPEEPASGNTGWSVGEALYFFVTPLLLAWALRAAARSASMTRRVSSRSSSRSHTCWQGTSVTCHRSRPSVRLPQGRGLAALGRAEGGMGPSRSRRALANAGSPARSDRWPVVRSDHACRGAPVSLRRGHPPARGERCRFYGPLGAGTVGGDRGDGRVCHGALARRTERKRIGS